MRQQEIAKNKFLINKWNMCFENELMYYKPPVYVYSERNTCI